MDDLEEELDALERILCGQKEPDSLDFRLLRQLTGNFSDDRRIGEGGCGEVYKGFLPNGEVIAVKKLKKVHIIDEKMFLREVDSMIKVRHQNIVRFLGYCSEIKEKAVLMDGKIVMAEEREKLLCFPYIRNGSLDKHLTDELRGFEWQTRYQIVKGVCSGLFHLHKEKGIMHMDLKPANILLGAQMVPKITDFGVSRIDGKTQITSAERLFSRGYAAPEYIVTGERSWKSDIYSLGAIMIELVTGSRKIPNTTKVLRRWRHRWNKSSKHTPLWYLQVKKCLDLAGRCQEKNPVNRPFIWDIVRELNELHSWDGKTTEYSLEKIITSSDDMLGIEPLQLRFTLAHTKQISCSIELTNDTDYYMAFRIVTTSVLTFSIQPNKGIAQPRSKCRATVTLLAQEMVRLPNHCKEELTVQSTRVNASFTAVDVTDDMFNDEVDRVVDEVNLTVDQKDLASLSAEMGSLGTSSQLSHNRYRSLGEVEAAAAFQSVHQEGHQEPLFATLQAEDGYCVSGGGVESLPDASSVLSSAANDYHDRLMRGPVSGSGMRVAFRTRSDVIPLDDGYRWRKYGRMPVVNNPHPRNYYQCSSEGCGAKKWVEREREDPRFVIITYDGIHGHLKPSPPPAYPLWDLPHGHNV